MTVSPIALAPLSDFVVDLPLLHPRSAALNVYKLFFPHSSEIFSKLGSLWQGKLLSLYRRLRVPKRNGFQSPAVDGKYLWLMPNLEHRFLYRENRVPHYQRLFQKHDGVRQWNKVSPSSFESHVPHCPAARHLKLLVQYPHDFIEFKKSSTRNHSP